MKFCLSLVLFAFALQLSAVAAGSYDATVRSLFHGFLLVTDAQCHAHSLSFGNKGEGVSRAAFDAWGAQHFNVHVVSHNEGRLEMTDEIFPRAGASVLPRCASQEQSFGTHIDGRIISWSQGNALGQFALLTDRGATKNFGFLSGHEPTVNGRHVFCQNGPTPAIGCDTLTPLVRFGRTRVRVYYKIVDSADGPNDEVLKIQTL